MTKYIALLRGINVGGHRKILMADLKMMLAEIGFSEVQTYIQSGNVVFSSEEKDTQKLGELIAEAIKKQFDFDVPTMVKTKQEWQKAVDENPFTAENNVDISKLYIAFLDCLPSAEGVIKLAAFDFGNDKFKLVENVVYLKYATKAHESKLSNPMLENKLGVVATSRNWRTTLKMLELVG